MRVSDTLIKVICAALSIAVLGLVVVVYDMQTLNDKLKQSLELLQNQHQAAERHFDDERRKYQSKLVKIEQDLLIASRVRKKYDAAPRRRQPDEDKQWDSSGAAALETLRKEQITRSIEQKYSLLLTALDISPIEAEKLKKLLVQRQTIVNTPLATYYTDAEDIAIAVEQQQLFLQELDKHVANLLSSESFQTYELVKKSDFEQYQLKQFVGSLEEGERLTPEQENELLLAKLTSKQVYENSLDEANELLDEGKLEQASKLMSRSVRQYKDRYFSQARQYMNESQFERLSAYERRHFKQMLDSLLAAQRSQLD